MILIRLSQFDNILSFSLWKPNKNSYFSPQANGIKFAHKVLKQLEYKWNL
jgi:hypothetical protein